MWLTRRLPGRLGIGLSAATVTVSPKGLPCALPAVGAINAAAAAVTRHTMRFISVSPVEGRRVLLWIDAGRCARRRTEDDVALTRGCCGQPAPKSSERS